MTFEAAEAAINDAVAQDSAGEALPTPTPAAPPVDQAPAVPTPQGETPGAAPVPVQPAGEDTFTTFNPDQLPEELRPGWNQLQADYTRKTQELAEQRRQYSELGDPETLRAAAQLAQQLQDPQNWPALHAELSSAMQEMGLSPAQADAAAAQSLGVPQPEPQADPFQALEALKDDPDLAPVRGAFDAMKAEVEQMKAELAQERAQAQAEAQHQALVGELQRMESAIRQARPDYQDGDIDAIYELSSFYDGDLFQAAQRYEQIVSERVSRYLQNKGAVADSQAHQPVPGATVAGTQPPETPHTLDEAQKEAEAWLRANGLTQLA